MVTSTPSIVGDQEGEAIRGQPWALKEGKGLEFRGIQALQQNPRSSEGPGRVWGPPTHP